MLQTKRGLLIVVEGIDGSGKSTLLAALYEKITQNGHTAIMTKEPGGTALGKHLRSLLLNPETPLMPKAEYLLFAADHAQHVKEVVLPHLEQGTIVLSDRMSDSSFAYQGYGRDVNAHIIQTIDSWIMEDLKADITIYVKVPVELALERLQKRGIALNAFEKQRSFLERVEKGFETFYKDNKNVITLDGTLLPQELVDYSYTQLNHHFKEFFICNQ